MGLRGSWSQVWCWWGCWSLNWSIFGGRISVSLIGWCPTDRPRLRARLACTQLEGPTAELRVEWKAAPLVVSRLETCSWFRWGFAEPKRGGTLTYSRAELLWPALIRTKSLQETTTGHLLFSLCLIYRTIFLKLGRNVRTALQFLYDLILKSYFYFSVLSWILLPWLTRGLPFFYPPPHIFLPMAVQFSLALHLNTLPEHVIRPIKK